MELHCKCWLPATRDTPGVLRHGLKPKLINSFRIIRLGPVLALPAWAAGPGEQRMRDKEAASGCEGKGKEVGHEEEKKGQVIPKQNLVTEEQFHSVEHAT